MAGEKDKLSALEKLNSEYQRQMDNLKGIANQQERSRLATEQIANYQKMITELTKEQADTGKNNEAQIDRLLAAQRKLIEEEKRINTQLENQVKSRQRTVDLAKQLGQQLKAGWKYLQDQDKIIKSTNLNLGMSSSKAIAMRDAFEKSAGYVTRLGGTIGDIQSVMQGYADETGRARVMSAQMVKDITAIGKGTGLGIENATKLGAQFELMGYDARSTMEYVQGVVDTSERMGVNTTKVLKVVNDNFKRLNKYTFQQGVKGFAEMAMYAEKFRIDINQALNAADVARSLEGAIDLAAQLQVMGGEFAKTDPFQMLFLSRNDPAKFTEKIADMTKGVVTFRKMADGTFEKYISPADRDRLASVAKSMGMEASALTEIAQRQAEIQKIRQQMGGLGLSKEQKEVIEGAAIFNTKSGKFQVQLGETMQNIGELTKTQAEKFKEEQVLLEERAKQAMTFDETFKATIETLKASLLPILKGINNYLLPPVKTLADMASSGGWGLAGAAATLLAAAGMWKFVSSKIANAATTWVSKGGVKGFAGKMLGGKTGGFGGSAGEVGSMFTGKGAIRKGAPELQKSLGSKALKSGAGKGLASAGFGAAMAGAGAGVMLAAKGISELANAMSKLTPEQAESLSSVVKSLAWFMGGAALAAAGIAILGATATAAAGGLLAFGAAILMVGGGIGLATLGISKMADSFGNMFTALKDVDNLGEAAAGIAGITAALGASTLTLPSAIGLSMAIGKIGKHADNLVKVGNAFRNIEAVMSGSKDDFIAVEKAVKSISNMNTKGGGMLADLANLLKKPLQVEFKDKNVAVVSNITMEIDGKKLFNQTYSPTGALQRHENARNNKGDNNYS